ncbi:MAG: hypothetical protein RIT28_3347 [Pseudomonadota bacterium]
MSRLGLRQRASEGGADGARQLLRQLRHIQLDPLDVLGQNAELVAFARLPGLKRGELFGHLLPGGAFEHFAKEACLLPAEHFPAYRDRAVQAPWWRLGDRLARLDAGLIQDVLDEVRERGPSAPADLTDRGAVRPIDWSGWLGTGKAVTMALEVLRTRCELVVAGRRGRQKVYDLPERALGHHASAPPPADVDRWAILERVAAAGGLLAESTGPWWSSLSGVRLTGLPGRLVEEGALRRVRVKGASRTYLMAPDFLDGGGDLPDDGALRVLAPLDPLIWDRALVKAAFGFDYVWEVYKPAEARRFGWYVCPLLHQGELVGRIEARIEAEPKAKARAKAERSGEGPRLRVDRLWEEPGRRIDLDALRRALGDHAARCDAVLGPIPPAEPTPG